jgi:hypothetical protein
METSSTDPGRAAETTPMPRLNSATTTSVAARSCSVCLRLIHTGGQIGVSSTTVWPASPPVTRPPSQRT